MKAYRYVVGFAFDERAEYVLLVHKLKPEWQRGRLNGIGGKIEPGETPLEAMDRECLEETGLRLTWVQRGRMSGINNDGSQFECFVFYAYSDEIYNFEQKEDEPLTVCFADAVRQKKTIRNLTFLVPFGRCDDGCAHLEMRYEAAHG